MSEHRLEVAVRWSDADSAGIAYYPRFFEWYDLGCEAFFAARGLAWADAFPRYAIVGVPIVESGSRFLAPVRYGDVVTIRSRMAWVRARTFRMDHTLLVGATVCAEGFEVRAWVTRPAGPGEPLRATPIPDEVAARLRGDAR